jgi:hypothetical protein
MKYKGKIKELLSSSVWYHATTLENWHKIKDRGVVADINKETSDALDFGYGFYLTNKASSAERFVAMLKENRSNRNEATYVVIGFSFCPLEWFEGDDIKTYVFEDYDDEFALFVFDNRMNNIGGEHQHFYDAILGVMADSNPATTMLKYKVGELTKEQVLDILKKPLYEKSHYKKGQNPENEFFHQLSLHAQELCDIISPIKAYSFCIEPDGTVERKVVWAHGQEDAGTD